MMLPVELFCGGDVVFAVKRPLRVKVHFAPMDGVCSTAEGPIRFLKGDAVLTGVAGESWPVEREKFDTSYYASAGVRHGDDGTYVKRPIPVRAIQLTAPFQVAIRNGVLNGAMGDWLIEYGPDDFGIVRQDIFDRTYEVQPTSL